jgi:hypothetical protein
MKVIGALLIISGNRIKAREYLMQAHMIFESRGMVRNLKEVKEKMKALKMATKAAADLATL